jgi:hypothetical protein
MDPDPDRFTADDKLMDAENHDDDKPAEPRRW